MNPIYKFELSGNGTTQQAFPNYKDDLSKDFEKESGQQFFRAKLSGKLTFQRDDYSFIVNAPFDTQFTLEIFISYDAGQTWTSYWTGTFWKTDCEFDADSGTVIVTPSVSDQYTAVLAGMDKEYNLIELAPEIVPIKADKRPMIQVYVPGQSVIGCFLSGMWWEQECEPENDTSKLENQFYFALNKTQRVVDVLEKGSLDIPDVFTGAAAVQTDAYEFTNGAYKFKYVVGSGSYSWQIVRVSDETILWFTNQSTVPAIPYELTLGPNTAAGVTGNVKIYIHDFSVYARYVTDVLEINSVPTHEIPADDIVPNNRNYHRVIGYDFPDTISFSDRLTETPNQWGIYQPGLYYQPPYSIYGAEFFPVARNAWGRVSIWFSFFIFDWLVEESARQPFTLRDAYPLSSVISVLLEKIAPGVTHDATTDYSEFLYGTNLIGVNQTLLITPKSNVIAAGYDQPAQKAPITLNDVTNMLRDCFRCYWFIDQNNRFRIEHIKYFQNGGSYSETPVVGTDLTVQQVSRSGKSWAFGRDQYKFDKPEMAARYQFGWMDDVTQLFEGFPIDILAKYVNPEYIEQIQVNKFTSDIDYVLLNPNEISKDGFVLLAAIQYDLKDFVFTRATVRESLPVGTPYENLKAASTTRVTSELIRINGNVSLSVPNNYDLFITLFNENGNYTGQYYGWTKQITLNNVKQIAITVRYSNNGTILPSNVPNGVFSSTPNKLKLPYLNFIIAGNDHYLQNAYVAFCILQDYYAFDMPAPDYEINGVQKVAIGTKRLKNQSLRFPMLYDPDLVELIKTNLGNGIIEKISINLSSRNANATLKYDTE